MRRLFAAGYRPGRRRSWLLLLPPVGAYGATYRSTVQDSGVPTGCVVWIIRDEVRHG